MDNRKENRARWRVSVVIATLGNELLGQTINSLNAGTCPPIEVLVCIPRGFEPNVDKLSIENVRIIYTEERGQVAQRVAGFKEVKGDYILQLDDDCLVDPMLIEKLVNQLEAFPKPASIGPMLLDINTSKSIYDRRTSGLKNWLFCYLTDGKTKLKPGVVTKAGINSGVTFEDFKMESIIDVDWLPGGCVLHRKGSLVTRNYYPFPGKAYGEDLIHSYHLRQKGITLLVTSECACKTELVPERRTLSGNIRELYCQYRSRKYFLRLSNKSTIRLHLFFLCTVGYSLLRFLLSSRRALS